MSTFFLAALFLSVGAYLHTCSPTPEMRPENQLIDLLWRALAFASLLGWVGILLHGFYTRPWTDSTAALAGSFGINWWFGHRGPRPTWPAISMLFCLVGLGLGTWYFINP